MAHVILVIQLNYILGQTDKTWSIRLRDDSVYEESETLSIQLTDPVFVVLEHPEVTTVTIVDPEDGRWLQHDKTSKMMCIQQRLRSACTSMQICIV